MGIGYTQGTLPSLVFDIRPLLLVRRRTHSPGCRCSSVSAIARRGDSEARSNPCSKAAARLASHAEARIAVSGRRLTCDFVPQELQRGLNRFVTPFRNALARSMDNDIREIADGLK
jgi:hypothetical protein